MNEKKKRRVKNGEGEGEINLKVQRHQPVPAYFPIFYFQAKYIYNLSNQHPV